MEVQPLNNLKVKVSHRQILSFAIPIALAVLIPQINLLTNSIFLGRLSEEALGNAGITGVYYLIFAVAGHGMNNAMQIIFSRHAGGGSAHHFADIMNQGIRLSFIFALGCILFTWFVAPIFMQHIADPKAFPIEMEFIKIRILGLPFLLIFQMGNAFLIATLNSRYLMIGFLFEAAINILLDYLLIFGKAGFPAMGFNGAAVASVIAECVGMFAVFGLLSVSGLRNQYNLLKHFKYHKNFSSDIKKVATPLVFQFVLSVTTWLIFFLLIENRGITAKAISNTMRNAFGIAGIFIWAFAGTTNAMVSNLLGQGSANLVIKAVKMISLWSVGFCGLLILALNIHPGFFFKLFGQDEAFVSAGIPVIRMVSVGIIINSLANVWLNAVTGTGKTRVSFLFEWISISLYMGYTLYFMKVNYISLAMAWSNEFIYWSATLIMAVWYMRSKRWETNSINLYR